jgi:hypothetical protein
MRLQVDPNQPSSEQLRALGFSTSTPGAGPRDATGRTPLPRIGTRPSAPAEGAPRSKRTLMMIVAGIVLAIVVAIGAWTMLGKRPDLSTAEREELVSVWLARAEQRIGAGQLMVAKDAGDSGAFQYVQKVLEKEPGNAKAQTLLDTIATQLRTQAETAFVNGNADEAAALVAQGLQVRPQDVALLALKARIDQTRKGSAAQTPQTSSPSPTQATSAPVAPSTSSSSSTAAPSTVAPNIAANIAEAAKPVNNERGELLLNALPWGNVESVVDESQAEIKLPADASTPFVLPLPTGKYVVTYRNPFAGNKPVQVTATVEANRRATALASFATTSTQGYLSRAGF